MPTEDFGSHDPDFTEAQKAQCARIIDGLRTLGSKVMRLSGTVDELSAAADQIERLQRDLDAVTRKRAIETFRFRFDFDDPNSVMPFNPATGAFNPMSPDLQMSVVGERLVTEVTFTGRHETSPDSVQGGMVSALYDQLLAFAVMIHGKTGPSETLEVSFLARTPIEERLRFETWVERVEGDTYFARGHCLRGERKVTEATGRILAKYDMPVSGGTTA